MYGGSDRTHSIEATMDLAQLVSHRWSVTTPFGEIAYIDVGQGPVALFVHGVFLNGLLWRHVIEEVGQERRCIAVDLMGHGATRIDAQQDISMPAQADMLDALCEALGLDEVDLVGNDSGGAIAQIFAVRYPQRLRTLTLTNCDTHTNLPPEALAATTAAAVQSAIGPVLAELLRDPDLARSDIGIGVGLEHPERLDEEVIRAYLEPLVESPQMTADLERFITSFDADQLVSIESQLRELQVPTLVVWGTGDIFFDVSWADWLRDTVPGVRDVVMLEGAKLFFPEERAPELALHLRRHWAASTSLPSTG